MHAVRLVAYEANGPDVEDFSKGNSGSPGVIKCRGDSGGTGDTPILIRLDIPLSICVAGTYGEVVHNNVTSWGRNDRRQLYRGIDQRARNSATESGSHCIGQSHRDSSTWNDADSSSHHRRESRPRVLQSSNKR